MRKLMPEFSSISLPDFRLLGRAMLAGLTLAAMTAAAPPAFADRGGGKYYHGGGFKGHGYRGHGYRGHGYNYGYRGHGYRGYYPRGYRSGFYGGYARPYYGGYYGGYYGPRRFYRPGVVYLGGPRFYGPGYRYSNYRGGISGAEAVLIAGGIVGGAILIDSALERRARDRYDYERAYETRGAETPGAFDDEYYYRRDDTQGPRDDDRRFSENDRFEDDGRFEEDDDRFEARDDDDLGLLGGERRGDNRADGARIASASSYRAAYNECIAETRGAAGAGGLSVALPAEPTLVESLADGSVRMTARFLATNQRGQEWNRIMTCEADASGVTFLEIA